MSLISHFTRSKSSNLLEEIHSAAQTVTSTALALCYSGKPSCSHLKIKKTSVNDFLQV